VNPLTRKPSIRALILTLTKKVDKLMASVEEVTAALTTLTADLEGLATSAKAEFAKLEEEVAAGKAPELEPLKAAIEALDTKVKTASGEVPTN
jgi:hypothetical protein